MQRISGGKAKPADGVMEQAGAVDKDPGTRDGQHLGAACSNIVGPRAARIDPADPALDFVMARNTAMRVTCRCDQALQGRSQVDAAAAGGFCGFHTS